MLPVELRFGQCGRTRLHFTGVRQFALQRAFALRQLFQQRRAMVRRSQPASSMISADVTEAGAHHHGVVTVLFVVLVDFGHGDHARIFVRGELFLSPLALYQSRIRPTNGEIR